MAFLILLLLIGVGLAVLLPRYLRKLSPEPVDMGRSEIDRYNQLSQRFEFVRFREQVEEDQQDEYDEFKRLSEKYEQYKNSRNARMSPSLAKGLGITARFIGALFILISILGTSLFNVPQDHSAHFKVDIGSQNMDDGQIIAMPGQKGPQMHIYPPGWHFELGIKLYATVEIIPDVEVPEGRVLTLIAREGRDKPDGQYFADPWPESLDKKKMLESAKYALERNESGDLMRLQKGPQTVAFPPGKYRFNQYLYEWSTEAPLTVIEPGEVGVMKFNYGPQFDYALLSDSTSVFYGLFPDFLLSGDRPVKQVAIRAKNIPDNWRPSKDEPEFDYSLLDDPKSKWYNYFPDEYNVLTREMVEEAKLVPEGFQGVCWDVLTEGKYALNPAAVQVFRMETKVQTLNYWGGFVVKKDGVDFDPNYQLKPDQADVATDAISKDGFRMFIEFRVLGKVTKEQAPYAFVMWGTWRQIEDKNITPDSRSIMRNNAQTASCLDYFKGRAEQEIKTYEVMWKQQLRKGITVVDINYGEIRIDPKLLETQTRKVLADQNKLAWEAEQQEQDERIKTERKKALAEQQGELTKADIAKQQALFYKEEQELRGQADANYDRELADGKRALYMALADVIGRDNFATLEMLKVLQSMGIKNITPYFYYNGGGMSGDNAGTMSLFQGTVLSGMMGKKPGSEFFPEDFAPAVEPDSSTVVEQSKPEKKVDPAKKQEQPKQAEDGKK